jgi:hypothetical protein
MSVAYKPRATAVRVNSRFARPPVHPITAARRRVLVRKLGRGVAVAAAAKAAGVERYLVWYWIAKGLKGDPLCVAIARAHRQGQAVARRQERELVAAAAKLLSAGASHRGTAKAVGVNLRTLQKLIARAKGVFGRAPDPKLAPLVKASQRRARGPWSARARCEHCGAPLRAPARKAG